MRYGQTNKSVKNLRENNVYVYTRGVYSGTK